MCWYDINQCGYYERGRAEGRPVFGNIQSTLADLRSWSAQFHFGETSTFDPSDLSSLHRAYLFDVRCSTDRNGWLVTLWNETDAYDGKVMSMPADARVGSTDVVANDVAPGTIPGFPTYFYFRPDIGGFAGIRFTVSSFGHQTLGKYLDHFLKGYSQHTVFGDRDTSAGDLRILGYREASTGPVRSLNPTFRSSVRARPSDIQYLRESVRRIRKIYTREIVSAEVVHDRAWWQSLLGRMHLRGDTRTRQASRVQYEMSVDLTLPELDHVIAEWDSAERQADDEWSNVGFHVSGQSAPVWLNGTFSRGSCELDVELVNAVLVTPASVLAAAEQRIDELLALRRGSRAGPADEAD